MEIYLADRQVSSPGSDLDGSFNADGSFVVAAEHACKKVYKKVFGWFSNVWRSPRKSYSPTMAAAKSAR